MRLTQRLWASKVATAPVASASTTSSSSSSATRPSRSKQLQTWFQPRPIPGTRNTLRHDHKRQDIINPELCREAVELLRPSLPPRGTCHIIDLNPGACIWSEALHHALQPKAHVLVESEDSVYGQALAPLLKIPSSKYHLSSSTVDIPGLKINLPWEKSYIPDLRDEPVVSDQEARLKHTDHLIITANLTRKNIKIGNTSLPYRKLFLNEFHRGIAQQSDYFDLHKYGLVKLLAWIPDAEKPSIMPRSYTQRTKLSRQFEASCHIREIVSSLPNDGLRPQHRPWYGADIQSCQVVAKRQHSLAIHPPPSRTMPEPEPPSAFYSPVPANFAKLLKLRGKPDVVQKYIDAWNLANPDKSFTNRHRGPGRFPGDPKLKSLALMDNFMRVSHRRHHLVDDLARKYVDMERALLGIRQATPDDLSSYYQRIEANKPRSAQIRASIAHTVKDTASAFLKAMDDYRCALHEVLPWHIRHHEPLLCHPDSDFYPHQPMTLLEFTPKLSFATKINTSERHICFTYINTLFELKHYTTVQDAVEHLIGDRNSHAYSEFLSKIPQLTDPRFGGHHDLADFRMRTLKMDLAVDLAVAYESWPYRKGIDEMLAATGVWKQRK